MKRFVRFTACRFSFLASFAAFAASAVLSLYAQPAEAAETTRTITHDAIAAKYADAASKFADLDGVKVHYKDEGSGPAVLLVHGTFGDLADWDEWARILKTNYRVIRLDLPAFGITSEMPNGNYSVDRMLSLIDTLMDSLNVERFAITGISYGGLISFRYAATRTDRISALILLNSAGIETGRAAVRKEDEGKPPYNITMDPVVTEKNVVDFLQYTLHNHDRITPAMIRRKLDYANVDSRIKESIVARQLYERGNPQRVLAHVRAPSLVLWGTADEALSAKTADAFIDALKNAQSTQLVLYKNGGHMINVDIAVETANDAKTFLEKQLSMRSTGNRK